jgi:hypothetical protein
VNSHSGVVWSELLIWSLNKPQTGLWKRQACYLIYAAFSRNVNRCELYLLGGQISG